jgi:hypothetical protein
MKKQLLLLSAIIFAFMLSVNAQEEVIIGFDFSDNTDEGFTATSGLEGNLGYDIRAESDGDGLMDFTYTEGASDYAATATGWDNGADDKMMSIKFKADGYQNFRISSKQYSDATGPKEFQLQWRFSGGEWNNVNGGAITVGTDWTIGVIEELSLPADLDDPGTASIYVRWFMTSNNSVEDGAVDAVGVSKIDDVVIVATLIPVPDTIIGFDFSDNTDAEFEADSGIDVNLGYDIRAESDIDETTRTLTYTEGASDYAATADGWDNGGGDKFWSIKFKAEGYADIKISSKQYSDSDGPRNFAIQTKHSGDDWCDLTDATIYVASDWETGVLEEFNLPNDYDNPGTTSIYIRWLMSGNTSVSGGTVTATGISKIDDILITGFTSSGVMEEIYSSALSIYPNPCDDYFTIESSDVISVVEIYNTQGALVQKVSNDFTQMVNVNINNLSAGMYFVKIYSDNNRIPESRKIIIK